MEKASQKLESMSPWQALVNYLSGTKKFRFNPLKYSSIKFNLILYKKNSQYFSYFSVQNLTQVYE